jgi:demethylmenaquinone methyltransferase/2-methoxy-6-polyprenyl-1,4-benzoquinol methylase
VSIEKQSQTSPVVPHPPLEAYYASEAERRPFVRDLFDRTAHHYGWITRMMAFGSGEWYRRQALERAGIVPGHHVLDVCLGTGQVARPALALVGETGAVIGLDASLSMLANARSRTPAPMVQAVVERIPLREESFDAITMGYALRHVIDLVGVFREYARLLRPGGRVVILELTQPRSRSLRLITKVYLKHVVPTLSFIRGGREARLLMRYFWDTIAACVPPQTIVDALSAAGLEQASWRLMHGVFSEYTAIKPDQA